MQLAMPLDWNEVPFYFVVIAIGLAVAGVLTFGPLEHGGAPAYPFLLIVAPVAWFGTRVVRYLRETHTIRFETDAVELPKLSLFGSPRRIAYADVERVWEHMGLRVALSDGSSFKVNAHAHRAEFIGALELRVGHALERRGLPDRAVEFYKRADSQHDPALDARIAFALWKIEQATPHDEDEGEPPDSETDPDEGADAEFERAVRLDALGQIFTRLHQAEWDHRETFGAEHPCTQLLQRAIERFRTQYPGVEVDDSLGSPKEQREERLALSTDRKPMQDRWSPVPD